MQVQFLKTVKKHLWYLFLSLLITWPIFPETFDTTTPVISKTISNYKITAAEVIQILDLINALPITIDAKQAIADLIDTAGRTHYLPPGIRLIDNNYEAICAGIVSRVFWSIFGNEDSFETARGVSGNAWDMAQNVRAFGGEVFTWQNHPALHTGDIIGMYYNHSQYNDPSRTYTHLAMVIATLPNRGTLIVHWWKIPEQMLPPGVLPPWFFRLEFLEDLFNDFPGLFIPMQLIRPRAVFGEF